MVLTEFKIWISDFGKGFISLRDLFDKVAFRETVKKMSQQ